MSLVYQYDANGYFVGQCDDYGGSLPHNCTAVKPVLQEGFIPHWTGKKWEQVENHKGKEGYVNGERMTVKTYGPLPDGWSGTPPAPTTEELFDMLRSFRDGRISAVLWMRERHSDELALGKETTLTPEQYTELLTYIQALRDIPAQPGVPWDGGGELTPWPAKPEI